jgi:hypothetical protein
VSTDVSLSSGAALKPGLRLDAAFHQLEAATSYHVRGTLSLKLDPSGMRHVDAKVDKLGANFEGGRAPARKVEPADGGV